MSAEVHGWCARPYAGVAEMLHGNLARGDDVGASVAVVSGGEVVVDLWGGAIDDLGTPWAEDTLVNVYSVTKTMTSLCALLLVDRGDLDVDAPVARYWPEFAARDKDDILVRHVLSHAAGLPGWDERTTIEDLYDWDLVVGRLERQAPWWPPGTRTGYHALTQGYLLGELVRRVTGATIGTYFADEVAGPAGADFHIGLPPQADRRVAALISPTSPPADGPRGPTPAFAAQVFANPVLKPRASATDAWRRASIPAANGHGNARAIALAQSALCGASAAGPSLSQRTVELALEARPLGPDLVIGQQVDFGLGYARWQPGSHRRRCYWSGFGGSIVVIDVDLRTVVAYAMNRMVLGGLVDDRANAFVTAALAIAEAAAPR